MLKLLSKKTTLFELQFYKLDIQSFEAINTSFPQKKRNQLVNYIYKDSSLTKILVNHVKL